MSEREIRLWDLPVRVFHWLLVALVVAAVVSVKMGEMTWHGRFGQAILALIVFRIIWGFNGPTHARFWHFVRGPRAIVDEIRGRWRGVGHNPMGALSVLAMLGVIGFQATSGLFANDDITFRGPLYRAVSGGTSDMISGWHRQAEWVIYGLIALHIAAVMWHTLVRKDNLIRPMITGRKRVPEDIAQPSRGGGWLAFVIAVGVTAGVMWVATGGLLPAPLPAHDPGW